MAEKVVNKQLNMLLVSDMVNFDDIIIEALEHVLHTSTKREFLGNVFHLIIYPKYTFVINTLDPSARCVVISTKRLYDIVQ